MPDFKVVSPYEPAGDQPEAIAALAAGIENGLSEQALLGVTGSGKTFTMAKVIEKVQKPTLVLAHNSPRPISPTPTPSSRRTPPPTMRSTGCVSPLPPPSSSGGTSSWSPPSPASTAWASRTTMPR